MNKCVIVILSGIILSIIGITLIVIAGSEWFNDWSKLSDDVTQDKLDWKQYLGISLLSLSIILVITGIFMCIFR